MTHAHTYMLYMAPVPYQPDGGSGGIHTVIRVSSLPALQLFELKGLFNIT